MNYQKFTSKQESVLSILNNEHLTSEEILNQAKNIPHILKLYSVLDELRKIGVVHSYMKKDVRYHHVA
ncbi:MAG: hypothetical protein JXR05_09630 [Flavobacteriaceae bacterium]